MKKKQFVYQDMKPMGVVLWLLGSARLYKSGDACFSAVFRPWHPLTWLVMVAMVLPCAIIGEKLLDVVPLRLPEFWRVNAEQLQWVAPWTRLDTLKRFDMRRNRMKYQLDD